MRKFARTHWKVLIAILLAIALASITLETDSATPSPPIAARLKAHVQAIASVPPLRHIETALRNGGYAPHRQAGNIEAAVSNVAVGARPERIFIVGADSGGAESAAVLELARLLKSMQPSRGTEVRFVFFDGAVLERDSFIAFAGSQASSARVRGALAAFRSMPDGLAQGLAAPAHVMGVTLSGFASPEASTDRQGYPALMLTETAFLRYPYFRTAQEAGELDYGSMARVVQGLARTIESLAGATEM